MRYIQLWTTSSMSTQNFLLHILLCAYVLLCIVYILSFSAEKAERERESSLNSACKNYCMNKRNTRELRVHASRRSMLTSLHRDVVVYIYNF